MIYRWLTYDRQDSRFKFLQVIDYTARTTPRTIWSHREGQVDIETHTAEFRRYSPIALYQFPDNTIFHESLSFYNEVNAWEWWGGRAVVTQQGMDRERFENLVRTRAYFLWVADGRREGQDIKYWLEAERGLRHLLCKKMELARFYGATGNGVIADSVCIENRESVD